MSISAWTTSFKFYAAWPFEYNFIFLLHVISTCVCLLTILHLFFQNKNIFALKQANNKIQGFGTIFLKLCTLWNSDRLASYRLQVQSSCSSCHTGTIWQRSPCPPALGSGRQACACRKSWSIRWPDPWTPVESATEADRPIPWINSSHPPFPPTTKIKIVCVWFLIMYFYVKVFHLTDH